MGKANITTVDRRKRLEPRKEPYWHKVARGKYIGYRATVRGEGTWIARAYDPAKLRSVSVKRDGILGTNAKPHIGGQTKKALGDFGSLPPSLRFAAACKEAAELFAHLDAGGAHDDLTVREVCEKFADTTTRAGKGRADTRARFERYVYNQPIAHLPVRKLARRHVEEWRAHLAKLPMAVARARNGTTTRERAAATLNRDMTPLRAALNWAYRRGYTQNALAWLEPLSPIQNADRKREVTLTQAERALLVEKLPTSLQPFARALCLLPIRPGALAKLRVADYSKATRELSIHDDKGHGSRTITLGRAAADLFIEQCRGKIAHAPIFTRDGGAPWGKDSWKLPFRAAVAAAGLDPRVSAYTLRHSALSDLARGGDLLSIAQISGTSLRMIERHYSHLDPTRCVEILDRLSPAPTGAVGIAALP